jgi:branched-chain amino acid transport system permease protein
MSVEDNIVVGAEDHSRLRLFEAMTHVGSFRSNTAASRQRAAKIMDLIGVGALAQTSAGQLTFGQQRLVATGRALASDPQLLLLDEPAAGLSGGDIDALARAVRDARDRGATVLLVEHNMDVIMHLCEHIVVMHLGEKIGDGSPDEVRQSERVLEAYLGA